MNSKLLNIRSILDLEQWQKIQDELALVTGMAILIVDYKGVPVTRHSGGTDFCAIVRKNPDTAKYCQKCDSRGGIEAARLNKPFMYLCHCDILDTAIPIVVDEKYIGAVMAGQVMADETDASISLEKILMSTYENSFISQDGNLREKYGEIPRLPVRRISAIIGMLFHLCNYIVGEAISKNMMSETYEKILAKEGAPGDFADDSLNTMMDIKEQVSKAIMTKQLKTSEKRTEGTPRHQILRPVVEYIHNNKHENIMLAQMAQLSHTSPSYLSRLFKKEMGKTFSDYVADFKMTVAKELLENTDLSVTDISNDLGFSDSGYFIKIFKKHEGVTPAIFRKYMK